MRVRHHARVSVKEMERNVHLQNVREEMMIDHAEVTVMMKNVRSQNAKVEVMIGHEEILTVKLKNHTQNEMMAKDQKNHLLRRKILINHMNQSFQNQNV